MYYREFLRVRRLFAGFAVALFCITALVLLLAGHVQGSVSLAPAGQAVVAAAAATDNGERSSPTVGVQIQGNSQTAPIEVLFAIAGFIAAIFGMVVGCALSCENNGHLEVAWTRPVSRMGYALQTVLVDWAGILAIFVLALALCALALTVEGWWPNLHAEPSSAAIAARMFAFPFAWYGLVAALTASLRGGAGLVAGLSWPVASVSIVLQKVLVHHSLIVSKFFAIVNLANPLLYTSFSDMESGGSSTIHALVNGQALAIVGLVCIALGGVAASLLQWRRLEA